MVSDEKKNNSIVSGERKQRPIELNRVRTIYNVLYDGISTLIIKLILSYIVLNNLFSLFQTVDVQWDMKQRLAIDWFAFNVCQCLYWFIHTLHLFFIYFFMYVPRIYLKKRRQNLVVHTNSLLWIEKTYKWWWSCI